MSERVVHNTEAALVCQTIQAVFVSEQDLDLQIRIHVEKNEVSHHLVDLLKMGIITWNLPSCKILQSKGVCDVCCRSFATTQGEIHMCLGVNGSSKCQDCLQNPQGMEKTLDENEADFAEKSCGTSREVIKIEGQKTSKNNDDHGEANDDHGKADDDHGEANDDHGEDNDDHGEDNDDHGEDNDDHGEDNNNMCREESDVDNHEKCVNLYDGDDKIEKNTSENAGEIVEDIHEHSLEYEQTVLDALCMEVKVDRRRLGRKSYVQFECRICSKLFPSKATIFQHLDEQHNDEVNSSTFLRDSAQKTLMGNISGDEEVSENSDQSTSRSTVIIVRRRRNDSNIRPYKCQVCVRTYQSMKTLKRHQRTSHKTGELKKLMENVEVAGNTDHSVSVKVKQNEGNILSYKCEVCDCTYRYAIGLKRHKCIQHKTVELKEPKRNVSGNVDAIENSGETMGRSKIIHEKMGNINNGEVTENTDQGITIIYEVKHGNDRYIRPYKCELCGLTYQLMKTLKRHQRTCHKTDELKEPMGYVDVERNTDQSMGATVICVKRKRNDSNIRPHECEVCGRSYQSIKAVNRHKFLSHKTGELKEPMGNVDIARNTDESMDATIIHVKRKRNNSNIRPHECEVCGRIYQSMKALNKHNRFSHKSGELKEPMENVVVAGNSDQSVGDKIACAKRRRNDSNIQPYKCEICGLTYQYEKTMKKHKKIHVDAVEETNQGIGKSTVKRKRNVSIIRPYECEVCSNTYQTLSSLKSHEQTHHIGNLICGICGQDFHLQSRLEYHMRLHTGERPFKCTICSSTFKMNSTLTRHLKMHNDKPAHTCPKCGKGFTEACYLNVHLRNHSGERPFQCHVCGKCFTNASSVNVHQEVHNDRTYKCETCLKIFKTFKTLQVHKAIHTSLRSNICEICGRGFVCQSRLKRHKQIHTSDRPYECGICNKTYFQKSDLEYHAITHNDEKPFKCDVCDKSFLRKKSLVAHSHSHNSEFPHKCTECGKGFSVLNQLEKHSDIHTSTKRFICEVCGKAFRLNNFLKSHLQTHNNGYRTHACDICGRRYRSVWYMQVHRKTHTGENLIQCKDCGDWFVNPSYFKKHQRKHCKGGKLVYCGVCNHKFPSNKELEKHMGLHTGERPFDCQICGVAFAKKPNLQDHIKRHTQENIHKCGTCGKGFKRPTDVRKHEKRHIRVMKALLKDDVKPGHNNSFAAVQETDILQQATESIQVTEDTQVTESISDANESGLVYVEAVGAVKDLVPLSTIDGGQVFLEADNNRHLEQGVLVEIDHSYISGASSVHSIQTSEGISPSQSFNSADRIVVQVDHPYITSQTAATDTVQMEALSTETCGMFSSAGHMEVSVAPAIQILPSVSVSEVVVLKQGQLETLALQPNTSSSQTDPTDDATTTHEWIYQ